MELQLWCLNKALRRSRESFHLDPEAESLMKAGAGRVPVRQLELLSPLGSPFPEFRGQLSLPKLPKPPSQSSHSQPTHLFHHTSRSSLSSRCCKRAESSLFRSDQPMQLSSSPPLPASCSLLLQQHPPIYKSYYKRKKKKKSKDTMAPINMFASNPADERIMGIQVSRETEMSSSQRPSLPSLFSLDRFTFLELTSVPSILPGLRYDRKPQDCWYV